MFKFKFTIVRKDHYDHIVSEVTKLAIANVELSKENARQMKIIQDLTGDLRVLNARLALEEGINTELQDKVNRKYPRKPKNKKLWHR